MTGLLRRAGVIGVGALLVVVTACSSDKKPAASSVASSPGSVASVSSASASSAPPPSTTGPCEAPAVPGTAANATTAEADYNGDGEPDTMTVYGTGTASAPAPYRLNVELGGSQGRIDVAIADAIDSAVQVKALGSAEITASAGLPPDGSGEELFVQVGSGASAALVGVFQVVECTLTRLRGPQGQQLSTFAIGGSVTHLGGLRCDGAAGGQRLVQLSATSDDGITYATTEARLEVQDGVFTTTNTVNDTVAADDSRLQAFSSIDCRGVANP